MSQLLPVSLFGCFLVWIIYFVWYLSAKTKDGKNTEQWREWAKGRDDLVYYDFHAQCTRYTKTGEKCIKLRGLDVDGEPFEYVATKPVMGVQKIKGLRYADPHKRDKEVKVNPKQMAAWKANGSI